MWACWLWNRMKPWVWLVFCGRLVECSWWCVKAGSDRVSRDFSFFSPKDEVTLELVHAAQCDFDRCLYAWIFILVSLHDTQDTHRR